METQRGTVKWFNNRKGFGFIVGSDGRNYFVHYTNIKAEGFKRLETGEDVMFSLKDTEKGPEAVDVVPIN